MVSPVFFGFFVCGVCVGAVGWCTCWHGGVCGGYDSGILFIYMCLPLYNDYIYYIKVIYFITLIWVLWGGVFVCVGACYS